jgi:death on curing protein
MICLTPDHIILIHDDIIGTHELQGMAADKSLDAAIDRIIKRIEYGLITDVYLLAACYATFIAQAHTFNDANKRTAFAAMDTVLALNGIDLIYDTEDAGNVIIKVVVGKTDENDLANWLRGLKQL